MSRTRAFTSLAVVVALGAAALAGGAIGAAVFGDDGGSQPAAAAAGTTVAAARAPDSGGLTPEQIYGKDGPGVVLISDTQTEQLSDPFGGSSQQQVRVLGSGFVLDSKGDIVTNDHVVQDATAVRVGFTDGSTYPARVVGTDPSTDLAVIRVHAPASVLHPLTLGDSKAVQVGDPVYAIGNPFGLDRTMTAGIVSAVNRSIQAPNGLAIENALQTDAAINHGNSGGPLIDRAGSVIGVSSQIETGGTSQGNVGVGFAVPSSTVRSIVRQLLATGHAEHPYLGVSVETIDPLLAQSLNGIPAHGVLVVRIAPGSPAARAGLVAGDRQVTVAGEPAVVGGDAIVSVEGKRITSASELAAAVAGHRPGDRIQLGVVRDGATRTVTVTLGNAPTG